MDIDSKAKFNLYIKQHGVDGCIRLYDQLSEAEKTDKNISAFSVLLKIGMMEKDESQNKLFQRMDMKDFDDYISLYYDVKYALRRIEFQIDDTSSQAILKLGISKQMLLMMISLFSCDRKKVAGILEKCYQESNNVGMSKALHMLENV